MHIYIAAQAIYAFCVYAGVPEEQSLSVQTLVRSALAGPQQGPAAQANADLILSCLQGNPAPAEELAQILHQVLRIPSAGREPEAATAEDDNAIITGRYHADTAVGVSAQNAALAVLLVQRLLQTMTQQSSDVLPWQTPTLDALAYHLASFGSSAHPQDGSQAQAAAAKSAPQEESAEAGDLAAGVAAAPLDASERTDAAQQPAVSDVSRGVAQMSLGSAAVMTPAEMSCAQLLGLLVSGRGNTSLLSEQAVQQVFHSFKSVLGSEANTQGMAWSVTAPLT